MKGDAEINCKLSESDFRQAIRAEMSDVALGIVFKRFDNVLVGTKEIAKFHNVNDRTVLNYVRDGLIDAEMKLGEKDHNLHRNRYDCVKSN